MMMPSESRRLLPWAGFAALVCLPSSLLAQPAPDLRTAASFAVLGGSAVTSSGATKVTGNVGVSPGTVLTGLAPNAVTVGRIYDPDDRNDRATVTEAQSDNAAAWGDLAGRRPCRSDQPLTGTLPPGVYCFPSAQITGTVTLDAGGNANAVWIFLIADTLTTAASSSVVVTNGGQASCVFWQVGSSATLGASSAFVGSILALTDITLNTGASLSGRALAQTGAVTMDSNNVSLCCAPITLSPPTLPDGVVCTEYGRTTITASGGTAPYTFTTDLMDGLSLSTDGVISGVPAKSGTISFQVTATDFHGCRGTQDYAIDVICPTIDLLPSVLPDATACSAWCQTITASCGTGDTFSVSSGMLPDGLTLSSAGSLCGTPATPGDYMFVVTASDPISGCVGSRMYTLHVTDGLTISPSTLPDATACMKYCQQFTGSCGLPPYTFTLTSGTLPDGLKLSSTGQLCGIPGTPGSSTFTVTVTDALFVRRGQIYTLVVNPLVTISPPTLPNATACTPYCQQLTASCGTAPYTFSLTSGTLPEGLTLSPAGLLCGTPTTPGTSNFVVTATDARFAAGHQDYTLQVIGACMISPPALPDGTVGIPYSQAITATCGTAPYTCSVTAGALPPGLSLAGCAISGTPATTGCFPFTVTVTDALGISCNAVYTICVHGPVLFATGTPLSAWALLALSILLAGAGVVAIRRGGLS